MNATHSLASRYRAWQQLEAEREQWRNRTLAGEFATDPQRAERLTIAPADSSLWLDLSKNHLTEQTLQLLCDLAREAQLPEAIEALFSGETVNNTEQRAALHTALRSPGQHTTEEKQVQETLGRLQTFVEAVHSHTWLGFHGQPITDVVNIGIGGSDLGARMAVSALQPYHVPHTRVHFVTNIDGADIATTLADLNPATTLFVVASKTFTTLETLTNAQTARDWLLAGGCPEEAVAKHFVAITTNRQKATEFGIAEDNLFPLWDWVGGRYSLWSAIGLPIALAVGMDTFKQLLAGAHRMDEHFRRVPLSENLPVLQALVAFWYNQFWDATSQVVLPYNHLLQHFPAFLQQLDMESLGKSVDREGQPVDYPTGLVVWGSEGTNGQHSFHQLLHQGTQIIPADFIAFTRQHYGLPQHHDALFACCLSQSQALMQGKSHEEALTELRDAGATETEAERLAPHKIIPGNRPSSTLVMKELTPESLGELIALYEHKVFTLGVLLNINPFDQWGVELGKQLSKPIIETLRGDSETTSVDASTRQLMQYFRDNR